MATDPCPTPEELRLLGSSHQGTGTFRRIEVHVERCVACIDLLEAMAGQESDDTAITSRRSTDVLPQIPGFVIIRKLGRGGAGVVYEAQQTSIGRKVALKLLTQDHRAPDAVRKRWLTEVRALGKIRHPHVVRLLDAGEYERQMYLALELISGGTLKSRMTNPVPIREAVRVVESIARAVDVLHRSGILHLDIKPANILLDATDSEDFSQLIPLLSDFGISYCPSDHASDDDLEFRIGTRGTPSYMAPEQLAASSQPIGRATDIFSLGATLYALLTGRPPFQAATSVGTLEQVRACAPIPPRHLVPDLPLDLETICLVCLSRDPARRYATALELAEDLRRWLDGHVILTRPVSRLERLIRWHRRQPTTSSLVLAAAAATATTITGLTWLWSQSEYHRLEAQAAVIRAERGESLSAEAVQQLLVLLPGMMNSAETGVYEKSAELLTTVTRLTTAIRQLPSVSNTHLIEVLKIEKQICEHFERMGADNEWRSLLIDAGHLVELHQDRLNSDPEVASMYVDLLYRSAYLHARHNQFSQLQKDLKRAEDVLLPHSESPVILGCLFDCLGFQRDLSERLKTAHPEFSAQILETGRATLRRFLAKTSNESSRMLLTSVTFFDSQDQRSVDELSLALRQFPAALTHSKVVEEVFAGALAEDLCCRAVGQLAEGQSPPSVAVECFEQLNRQADPAHFRAEVYSKTVEFLAQRSQVQETIARRAGNASQSQAIVTWMFKLGEILREHHPRAASPHYLLSKAFEHESKLAWTVPDAEAAAVSLHSSLIEAILASNFAPDRDLFQHHAARMRNKYLELVSDVPEQDGPSK